MRRGIFTEESESYRGCASLNIKFIGYKENMRNEDFAAALKTYLIYINVQGSGPSLVPVRPAQYWKFTLFMPMGSCNCARSPARKKTA